MQPVRHLSNTTVFFAGIIALLLSTSTTFAQRIDSKGREFRIVFMPTNGADEFPSYFIDISCDRPTKGKIRYENSGKEQSISIPVANQPVVVRLDSTQLMLPNPGGVEKSTYTLRLEFVDEVTVHGINTQRWSSDGFLALPLDAVGSRYYVLSYPSTISSDVVSAGLSLGQADFYSQFAVIGTVNNTTVQISPSTRLNARKDMLPFNITLKAGEVFLAQAAGIAGVDVTGTSIVASKPVVVFSGHQRANVPWDDAVGRDHLVEQLPPTEHWEKSAIVVPPVRLARSMPDTTIARILASEDGTVVNVGDSVYSLNSGAHQDVVVNSPHIVTSNNPILVAQFQHSVVPEAQITMPVDSIGDPFMALMPSPEQFMDSYVFESYGTEDLLVHYATVVLPTDAMFTLRLDGYPVVPKAFDVVSGAPYVSAHLQFARGSHMISAARPFGLMVYSYGPYNSYGFPAGMTFEPIPLGVEETVSNNAVPMLTTRMSDGMVEMAIEGDNMQVASIALFDVLGRHVLSPAFESNRGGQRIIFNIAELPAGTYFCRIMTGDGIIRSTRIVIP